MSPDSQPPMPTFSAPDPAPDGAFTPQSQSWSAAAISGFVLSLVGCLVITGVLGLIFGIVGIIKTSGGRRRGRGLAIAAIPISVVLMLLGAFSAMGIYMVARAAEHLVASTKLMQSVPDDAALDDGYQDHFTESFRDAVSKDEFRAWLITIKEKHGSLVGQPQNPNPVAQGDTIAFMFDGKFVNGTAPVVIRFVKTAPFEVLIDDIEVDGQSARGSP